MKRNLKISKIHKLNHEEKKVTYKQCPQQHISYFKTFLNKKNSN